MDIEMSNQVTFHIDDVFEFTDRGLVLVGISGSEWNEVKPGHCFEVKTVDGLELVGTVKGVEWPNWITRPVNPKYGVCVSGFDSADKMSLVGGHATITPVT